MTAGRITLTIGTGGSLNASVAPNPGGEPHEPQNQIGAIDIDPNALLAPRIRVNDRILAALSYIGALPVLVAASRPNARFVRRHVNIALTLFTIRILWTSTVLAIWWLRADPAAEESRLQSFVVDVLETMFIGIPFSDTWRTSALPWLLTPSLISLAATVIGASLAAAGRSADFGAFASADWSDPSVKRNFLGLEPDVEKEKARRARERQIERLQKSSRMLRTEEARRVRISDVGAQIDRIELQRDYHDQLLALGEISQRRYEQVNAELDEQAAELRAQLSSLETRVQSADGSGDDRGDDNRLRRPSETQVESIAIVTPDGVPIFTYGQFQLDDAIVAGMLSAFDSLSEEVFGSRVSKTALAEGQVLYFAHGDYVLIMASFTDEPSPRQIEDLRKMLKQFESANEGPISRLQYDPRYLHEVPIPFKFIERFPRGASTSGAENA